MRWISNEKRLFGMRLAPSIKYPTSDAMKNFFVHRLAGSTRPMLKFFYRGAGDARRN
jgi:hypothetical protein